MRNNKVLNQSREDRERGRRGQGYAPTEHFRALLSAHLRALTELHLGTGDRGGREVTGTNASQRAKTCLAICLLNLRWSLRPRSGPRLRDASIGFDFPLPGHPTVPLGLPSALPLLLVPIPVLVFPHLNSGIKPPRFSQPPFSLLCNPSCFGRPFKPSDGQNLIKGLPLRQEKVEIL